MIEKPDAFMSALREVKAEWTSNYSKAFFFLALTFIAPVLGVYIAEGLQWRLTGALIAGAMLPLYVVSSIYFNAGRDI